MVLMNTSSCAILRKFSSLFLSVVLILGTKPTQMGLAVQELQHRLPKARVVYCSATGCSEPADMAYMLRLGLWGPRTAFPLGFGSFRAAFDRGGVGMM